MKRSWLVLSPFGAGRLGGPLREVARTTRTLRAVIDPLPDNPPNAPFVRLLPVLGGRSCLFGLHPMSSYHSEIHTEAALRASAASSGEVAADSPHQDSFGTRVLKFIGWMGGFYSRKAVLVRSSKTLYENCMDNLKYEEFFEACSLPDSFQSWFQVAHLHVWFFMVRLKREGRDGEYLIRQVVATFWYDVEHRMRAMEVYNSMAASRDFRELVQQFYGLTLAYEEGLLSSDKLLAAAIWRNMLFDRTSADPTQLAKMVEYVRRQVQHMDRQDSKALLERGTITLLPFSDSTS